jgi:hypothetical protein
LVQIRDVEKEILALLNRQREILAKQNENMQIAIDKLVKLKRPRLE